MQILQWLFKVAHEQGGQSSTTPKDQEDKPKDIILSKNRSRRATNKKFKPFIFVCDRDVAKACFYSSIYLRRAGNSQGRQHWSQSMKMKKGEINNVAQKSDSGSHGGNKVLPLSEAALSSSTSTSTKTDDGCSTSSDKKDKTKTMSRMKELLRWAAAAKSEKGGNFIGRKVMKLRNRGALKAVGAGDDDQFSNESPKISFRWDVESTSSSVFSGISATSSLKNIDQVCNMKIVSLNSTPVHGLNRCSSRRGNWITTDSEFVVLEL